MASEIERTENVPLMTESNQINYGGLFVSIDTTISGTNFRVYGSIEGSRVVVDLD